MKELQSVMGVPSPPPFYGLSEDKTQYVSKKGILYPITTGANGKFSVTNLYTQFPII